MFLAHFGEGVVQNCDGSIKRSYAAVACIVSSIIRTTSHSEVVHGDVLVMAAESVVVGFSEVSLVLSASAFAANSGIVDTSTARVRAPEFVAAFFRSKVVADSVGFEGSTDAIASALPIFAAVTLISAFFMQRAVYLMNCSVIIAAFFRFCALALMDTISRANRAAMFFRHAAWRYRDKAPFLTTRAAVFSGRTIASVAADALSFYAAEVGISADLGVGTEF